MATIKYKDENGWQEIAIGGGGVTIVDNLDSEDTTAALSANQGRVLKEMIEELPSGGGAAEGAKFYPIYSPKLMETDSITEEQQAANKAAFEAAARGDNMWCYAVVEGSVHFNASIVFTGDSEMLILAFESHSIYQDITATLTNVIINPDGSIMHEAQYEVSSPSVERVEEMIAQSSGGGGGTGGDNVYVFPSDMFDAEDGYYEFSNEEDQEFLAKEPNLKTSLIILPCKVFGTPTTAFCSAILEVGDIPNFGYGYQFIFNLFDAGKVNITLVRSLENHIMAEVNKSDGSN